MKTIENFIELNAKLFGNKIAVVCGERQCTYAELNNMVNEEVNCLKESMIHKGSIVTIRSSQTIEFLVRYFALHRYGCVAAPLERDIPESHFQEISAWLANCPVPLDSADILYTTGTTGKSKGVIISHRAIVANAENLIDGQGFSHDLTFIINGPLNHIGSLSKVYPIMMLGATLIIIEGMKDVNLFFDALNYPASKMATFLVPASIRILVQFCSDRLASYKSKIDFVETGAAPITHTDMQELCKILPKSRLYNTYASTETGIISTYNFNDGRCIKGCLGKTMKHSKIIITPEGLIACQGATLMTGYAGDPELTNRILQNDTIFTQDIGMVDKDGMLHLTGRQDDVINVGGFKVSPTEVENIAMALPEIVDCICIAVPHPIVGTALKLLVVIDSGYSMDKKVIARFIKSKTESYKVPLFYEEVNSIHKTYNGKIDRKYYRQKVE